MPILQQFQPEIILVSSGFDACVGHPHPLGGYELTPTCKPRLPFSENDSKARTLGFAYMTKKLMSLANGKVVLVLEGGYELNALAACGKLCVDALLHRPVSRDRIRRLRTVCSALVAQVCHQDFPIEAQCRCRAYSQASGSSAT
jgi:acetoin utilization deacetylase AcuC-like enzyme